MKKFFKKAKNILIEILWIYCCVRNFRIFNNIGAFKKIKINGVTYDGYHPRDEEKIIYIYKMLNPNEDWSALQRLLYRLQGHKMLLIARRSCKIIGMNMYYVTKKDMKNNTVHEGFIGIVPEERGKGIANKLREISKVHFKTNGFSGISTRISENNMPSYKSALKVGFKSVENYYDKSLKEKRHYMICAFVK